MVGGGDAEQLLGVVQGRVGGLGRAGPELAPAQVGEDLASQPQAVALVGRELVAEPAHPRVHVRAAELLVVGVLAGRHLHQRWAGEEDLRTAVDHHHVVAHARDVRAARGRVAEHQRDRRDPRGAQPGEVAEHPPAGDEDLRLTRQVRAPRLDDAHHRQAVLPGDVEGAQRLLQGVRVGGAAAHRRVVGEEHALDVADHPDPGHHRGADLVLGAVGGERRELEEGRVLVAEQLDALAREQLAAGVVALDVAGAAAEAGLGEQRVDLGEAGEHRLPVGEEVRGAGIDVAAQRRSGRRCRE